MRDGAETLDYLFGSGAYARRDTRIVRALTLLDLELPKVDGLEVVHRIRADDRTELIPVVILTSPKEEQDLINGYSLDANSYIRKPVDFAQFVDPLFQLALYWLVFTSLLPCTQRHR